MAQPTNTFDSYDAIGNRESLADLIYNIDPTDTPFMTMASRLKAKATFEEWQTQALAAASTSNAQIEGNDVVAVEPTPSVRVGNRTQISWKPVTITGTQEVVEKAGRKSEMAYQMMLKGKELKRDQEAILTGNQTSVTGNNTTARKLGSLEAWLTSNVSRGSGGASGGFSAGTVTAATDGTQRAFTELLLKTVIQAAWTNGGDPSVIMTGPFNKGVASGFTGIATQFREIKGKGQATITAGADLYVSDFGEHAIVPNRFSRDRSALCLDPDYVGVSYLRPFKTDDLAKTGDAEKKNLLAEYTLIMKNEKAHGIVADLTTS